jgi:putative ABC transport system permease protein
MFKNYFKITLRNIKNHKIFSFINITGLAIGIACSILIMLFVNYELSYDKYNKKADRIYRLAVSARVGDTDINQTYSSAITFTKLLEDFPEIETGVKFFKLGQMPIYLNNKIFNQSNMFAVDSVFYDVFSIPLIYGNPKTVLSEPNTIVLSRSTAIKYFHSINVIGKTLTIDVSEPEGKVDFKISGISEDIPANSHFHYDMLVSLTSFPSLINNQGWTSNNFISYIVLKEGTSKNDFDKKLKDFTRKYMGGAKFDEWVAKGNFWKYYLQPLTKIHLTSDLNGEFEANGNQTYVYIFSVISIIILLIACINFMNLSTARSSLRAKEVSLRKVVGSGRKKLIFQFLFESILLSYVALIAALIIVVCILPIYRNFVGEPVDIGSLTNFSAILIFIFIGLFVGLISGLHPAFSLSSFQPITALKNESYQKSNRFSFRNILVIFQFAISIFLIAGTIIIYQQLQYLQNKNLGFDKEQVLVVNNPGSLTKNLSSFKQSLRNYNNILEVSGSNTIPGKSFSNIGFGAEGIEDGFTLNLCNCDYDFAKTLNIQMAQGRFFSKEFPSDSSAVILNQKAIELLGWDNPLGKKINNWNTPRGNFTVIGVVKDYHYESLQHEIRPMALFLNGGYYTRAESFISIRLKTGNLAGTINYVQSKWNEFAPGAPFDFSFLDKDYDNLYLNEKQTMEIFSIFSLLAILIACLGLFGLTAFIVERRIKEIGIRKVLGATIPGIVILISKDFLKLVAISNIMAWPIIYFAMMGWLQDFAYRINISWWVFILSGCIALLIALFTISFQSIKAAIANPVNALKYE